MTKRMRELLEQRAAAWAQVQDIQSRRARDGYEPTTEDGETYTRALDDVERLSREVEEEERTERLSAQLNELAPGQRDTNPRPGEGEPTADDLPEQYRSAFEKYLRSNMGRLSPDEQRMLEDGFVSDEEMRAQGASVDAAGGFTVPKEFLQRMTEAQKSFGGILALAEVITTSTGRELS